MRHALLSLALLSLAFAPAPLPRRERQVDVGVVELSMLTPAQADRLSGRLVRYRVVLESDPADYKRWTLCDRRHEREGVAVVVWLPGSGYGGKAGDAVVLRGRLEVIRHERRGDRQQFGGWVELRLTAVDDRPPRSEDE